MAQATVPVAMRRVRLRAVRNENRFIDTPLIVRVHGYTPASVGLAVAVSLANVSVIGILVAASVIGGIGTPIGIVILVMLGRDQAVMGDQLISRRRRRRRTVAIVTGFGLVYVIGAALGKF